MQRFDLPRLPSTVYSCEVVTLLYGMLSVTAGIDRDQCLDFAVLSDGMQRTHLRRLLLESGGVDVP